MTYFFIKTIGLGPRWFHCSVSRNFSWELEFHLPRKLRHFIVHAALIENMFSSLVLLVKSTVFLCLTQTS